MQLYITNTYLFNIRIHSFSSVLPGLFSVFTKPTSTTSPFVQLKNEVKAD